MRNVLDKLATINVQLSNEVKDLRNLADKVDEDSTVDHRSSWRIRDEANELESELGQLAAVAQLFAFKDLLDKLSK